MYDFARPTNDNQRFSASRDTKVMRSCVLTPARSMGPGVLRYVADGSFILSRNLTS